MTGKKVKKKRRDALPNSGGFKMNKLAVLKFVTEAMAKPEALNRLVDVVALHDDGNEVTVTLKTRGAPAQFLREAGLNVKGTVEA